MELEEAGDVTGSTWLGFEWSDWALLEPGTKRMSEVPQTAGFFRIKKVRGDSLDYVGQTGRGLRGRIVHLANKVESDERPEASQASAEHLWELKESGGRLEFSYANPNIARSETDRIGIENLMFAEHIRSTGRSPTVNLDRGINEGEALQELDWDAGDLTSGDWMGLDWSEPRPLGERAEIDRSRVVYRIWFPDFVPPLAYIGKSTNVANRLIKHEERFGSRAAFSVAPLDGNLKDVEACLIASHYTQTNTLPKGQNGRRNRFTW